MMQNPISRPMRRKPSCWEDHVRVALLTATRFSMGSPLRFRGTVTPRIATVVVLAAASACSTTSPAKDASPDRADSSAAPLHVAVEAGASMDASVRAGPASCRTDADCRTFSSYCREAPCVCRVLAKDAPDPPCGKPNVACFADPCMRKTAACQDGRCALVMAPSR
jgi:hypothetical protein